MLVGAESLLAEVAVPLDDAGRLDVVNSHSVLVAEHMPAIIREMMDERSASKDDGSTSTICWAVTVVVYADQVPRELKVNVSSSKLVTICSY